MSSRSLSAFLLATLLPGAVATAADAPAKPADPWAVLDEARHRMVADGATRADFIQTFVPAGFTSGERESGKISLALPACLRWDYELPYGKSFLLCGEVLYFWNHGETSGRRARVDPQNEPGLDLLLLSVDELSRRYRATVADTPLGPEIALEPLPGGPARGTGSIARATLQLDPEHRRLSAIAWDDVEGNRTRFEFSGFRALAEGETFTPPADLRWEDEGGG